MAYIAESRVGQADTLPDWLQGQARLRGNEVALRHKRLGIWHEQDWQSLAADVARLAQALSARGVRAGDTLALLSPPHPDALRLSLAVQWLGGVAAPLDPLLPSDEIAALLAAAAPEHVYAADSALAAWARQAAEVDGLLLQGQERGIAAAPVAGFTALDALRAPGDAAPASSIALPPVQATPNQPAFAFYRLGATDRPERQAFSHVELLREGRALIATERLSFREEALAARAFAAGGQARYLLAPWLLAGFRLNFPENLATRDADRRELGPTLVLGTRETYGRLQRLLGERLPLPGSATRRLVDAALTLPPGPWWRRPLDRWLQRRLREVLGLSRARVPLLVGEPLPEEVATVFAALGVRVRNWPDASEWRVAEAGSPALDGAWQGEAPLAV